MLAFDPADRPAAAEARMGPYLNRDCSQEEGVRLPAPKPWTYEAVARAMGASPSVAVTEECLLPMESEAGGQSGVGRFARPPPLRP